MSSLTLDMEVPLNEAMHLTLALSLMGQGLAAHGDDEGRAVAEVAMIVCRPSRYPESRLGPHL